MIEGLFFGSWFFWEKGMMDMMMNIIDVCKSSVKMPAQRLTGTFSNKNMGKHLWFIQTYIVWKCLRKTCLIKNTGTFSNKNMGKHLDQTSSNLPNSWGLTWLQEHGWLIGGLETPGAPIIAPGESYRATEGHGAGALYEVHALQAGGTEICWRCWLKHVETMVIICYH